MMKERAALISQVDLKNYLRKNWSGFDTKDYELLAALLIARFHDEQFGKLHHLGFPVKPKTDREVPNLYTQENIGLILQIYREERTAVDIFVVPDNEIFFDQRKNLKPNANGKAFQLKRVYIQGDGTEPILEQLNKARIKYSPIKAALLLIIVGKEGTENGTFDIKKVAERFSPEHFPFQRAMFLTGVMDSIIFGEFWPDIGSQSYMVSKLLT